MITMSVMLPNIMQGVDDTILDFALPHVQGSLSASLDGIRAASTASTARPRIVSRRRCPGRDSGLSPSTAAAAGTLPLRAVILKACAPALDGDGAGGGAGAAAGHDAAPGRHRGLRPVGERQGLRPGNPARPDPSIQGRIPAMTVARPSRLPLAKSWPAWSAQLNIAGKLLDRVP